MPHTHTHIHTAKTSGQEQHRPPPISLLLPPAILAHDGMLQLFGLLALLATLRVSDAGRASDTAARGTPVEPCEQHGIPSAWTKPHGRPHISGALAGTADTQRALWAHQHPADCSRAQFFVATTWWGGIGGKLNQAASALGRAIAQGRVFLFDFDVEYNEFARGPPGSFCPNEGTLDTCFFVGLSNCTLVDVYGSEFVALAGSRQLSDGELEMKRSEVSQAAGGRILFEKVMDTRQWHDAAPPSIQPLMERALGKDAPRLALAWWRAQVRESTLTRMHWACTDTVAPCSCGNTTCSMRMLRMLEQALLVVQYITPRGCRRAITQALLPRLSMPPANSLPGGGGGGCAPGPQGLCGSPPGALPHLRRGRRGGMGGCGGGSMRMSGHANTGKGKALPAPPPNQGNPAPGTGVLCTMHG